MSDLPEDADLVAAEAPPTDFIEPPPATEFVPEIEPESRVALYDRQTEARLSGYSWPEIDDHLDGRTSAAMAEGYSKREVDGYLGLGDQQPLQDRLRIAWGQTFDTEDPQEFIEPPPKPMAITPLEGMVAGRMGLHAGRSAPAPQMPIPDEDAEPSSFNLGDERSRRAYTDALLSGEARTPLDFAERYAGAFWGALGDRGIDLDDSTAASLIRSSREMAAKLPSNRDLIDTSIALSSASALDLDVETVGDTKENLADYWTETGTTPMEAYKEALNDPLLEDALTSPPMKNTPPLPPLEIVEPEEDKPKGDDSGEPMRAIEWTLEELGFDRVGRDAIRPVSMFGEPVEHKTVLGDLTDLGITVAAGAAGHYVFKAGAYVVGSIVKSATGQHVIQGIGHLFADDTGAGISIPGRAVLTEAAPARPRVSLGAVETRETAAGGAFEHWPILSAEGKEIGNAQISREGRTAHIDRMGTGEAGESAAGGKSTAMGAANELGPRNVRDLARDYFTKNPDVDGIEGFRMTGARGIAGGRSVSISRESVLGPEMVDAASIPSPGAAIRQLLADESGAVTFTPGRITQAIATDLQAAMDRLGKARPRPNPGDDLPLPAGLSSKELAPIVTKLEDDLNRLRTNGVADKVVLAQMVESLPPRFLVPELGAKISTEVDRRLLPGGQAVPASPEVAEVLNALKPLTDRQTDLGKMIAAKTAGTTADDPAMAGIKSTEEGYFHRVVKGKEPEGSILDPKAELDVLTGGMIAGKQKSISTFAEGMQHRTMYVMESEDGARIWGSKELHTMTDPEGKGSLKFGDQIAGPSFGRWTVKQATMEEVEANTKVRYEKNFIASTIVNVAKLERVNRNLDLLATQAKDLEAARLFFPGPATFMGPRPDHLAGMTVVNLPGMRGWADPKIAYVLNEFFDANKGNLEGALTKINRFITGSLFLSPVVHIGNVGMHWAPGRGWDWIKPKGYGSLMKEGFEAVREVWTMGPRYVDHLRQGSGLLYGSTMTENFHQTMLTKLFHEQGIDKTWVHYAKRLDIALVDLVKAEYRWSRRTLWAANDMFMLQRQFELQRQGRSLPEAIFQAEKDIPNYRIPSEVMGSNAMAEFMKSPNAMMFGRYRYGQVRALALMVKDMVGPNVTGQDRIDAIGKATMLAFLGVVAYPLLNNGRIGAPLEAEEGWGMKPFGPYSLINAASEFTHGQKAWVSAMSSFIGLAPLFDIARRVLTNRDVWGRTVVDDKATWTGKVVQGLEAVGQTFPPSQILLTAIKDGEFNRAVGGLIGTTFKKPVDEAKKTKWDKLEQARATARERKDNLEQWIKQQLGITDETTSPAPRRQPSGRSRSTPSAPRPDRYR